MDSNHRSKLQQIYSLPPLATRELLRMNLCPSKPRRRPEGVSRLKINQIKAQRSGFDLERRRNRGNELLCPHGSERSGACADDGAGGRTRTPDLLITNQLLYQLSYTSI